jgi:hypothetical protein
LSGTKPFEWQTAQLIDPALARKRNSTSSFPVQTASRCCAPKRGTSDTTTGKMSGSASSGNEVSKPKSFYRTERLRLRSLPARGQLVLKFCPSSVRSDLAETETFNAQSIGGYYVNLRQELQDLSISFSRI